MDKSELEMPQFVKESTKTIVKRINHSDANHIIANNNFTEIIGFMKLTTDTIVKLYKEVKSVRKDMVELEQKVMQKLSANIIEK